MPHKILLALSCLLLTSTTLATKPTPRKKGDLSTNLKAPVLPAKEILPDNLMKCTEDDLAILQSSIGEDKYIVAFTTDQKIVKKITTNLSSVARIEFYEDESYKSMYYGTNNNQEYKCLQILNKNAETQCTICTQLADLI